MVKARGEGTRLLVHVCMCYILSIVFGGDVIFVAYQSLPPVLLILVSQSDHWGSAGLSTMEYKHVHILGSYIDMPSCVYLTYIQ